MSGCNKAVKESGDPNPATRLPKLRDELVTGTARGRRPRQDP